jgi:hypothetical protein
LLNAFRDKGFTLAADGSEDMLLNLGDGLKDLPFPKELPPPPPPRLTAKEKRAALVNDVLSGQVGIIL